MRIKLLDLLACPKCLSEMSCESLSQNPDGEIVTGKLNCHSCGKSYRIKNCIPRFVEDENYAASFGYQWNRFKSEQIDSINGTHLSEKRFYNETGWSQEWLCGKWILDIGCGAGRFLDVASRSDCDVVGVDISNATDAAWETLSDRPNVHLVQASIFELPFRTGAFDGCYCLGVIQHTPDPREAVRAIPRILRNRGRLALTIYERKPWTKLNAKYMVRPLTKRMNKELLLKTIRALMPFAFVFSELLFRIPYLGRGFRFVIPVANYVDQKELSRRERYDWAILDTFDMLAPQYDQPQTEEETVKAMSSAGIGNIRRLKAPGLALVGERDVAGWPFKLQV